MAECAVKFSHGMAFFDWDTGKVSKVNIDPGYRGEAHYPVLVNVTQLKERIAGCENLIRVLPLDAVAHVCSCGLREVAIPYELNRLLEKLGIKKELIYD